MADGRDVKLCSRNWKSFYINQKAILIDTMCVNHNGFCCYELRDFVYTF